MKILEPINEESFAVINDYDFHFNEIASAINERNRATGKIVRHVEVILKEELWKGHFDSAEDFVKIVLNLEKSSYDRLAKANRMYLYLVENTNNDEEKATLSVMKEGAYRELRRIATDGIKILKSGNESNEEYLLKLEKKENEDFELIKDLWNKIYPHIRFHKEQDGRILPNGACHISESDITFASKVLQETIEAIEQIDSGKKLDEISIADIDGKNYSIAEVIKESGEYAPQVIDAMNRLGISQGLTEKLKRQNQHIRDRLEQTHTWDRYDGICKINENGQLIICNDRVEYNMSHELSDLIGIEVSISVRRPNRKL